MRVYWELMGAPSCERAITIGVFDGVHIGHRALLQQLKAAASQKGLTAMVITFANHPQSVLNPPAPPLLTTIEERLELLAALGVDETLVLTFTPELSRHTAEEFCRLLVDKLVCRLLIVGDDFALGYRREGNVARLRVLGQELGFEVATVALVTNAEVRVASSEIRRLLLEGKLEQARTMLGVPYRIAGRNVAGAGRGRQLGFPTVNLQVAPEKLLPRYGVYAAWAIVSGERWRAAGYVGRRLTFGETEPIVEAYLLDFEGTVPYNTPVALELIAFIRPEERFETPEALRAQMERDVAEVLHRLQQENESSAATSS